MLNSFRKLPTQNLGELIQTIIFFILFYLYFWLKIDPRLIYHGGGVITNFPVFYRSGNFFLQFLSYPGGPVEYLCAFLSQLLYIGWAGALVITMTALLISVCTDVLIKATNAHRFRWVRFIPPMLLLITYNRYTYHFVTTVALLVALFFVCLYFKVTKTSKLVSLLAFFVLSIILYYIAGGAYLLFATVCAIYELFFSRRWQIALVYLLSAAVIPYVGGVLVSGVSIINAFSYLLPFSWKTFSPKVHKTTAIIIYILYLLLPLVALGLGLWRISTEKKVKEKPRSRILSWYAGAPILRWFTESCLLLVLAGTVAFSSHDDKQKALFEVDYYSYHNMWPQVLQSARRCSGSYVAAHAFNRALYHTGRISYDMFSYPQDRHTLFLTFKSRISGFWARSGAYLDLGLMNMAEYALTQSLEIFGQRPMILKRLALINLVKGNAGTARIYLGALSKTLFDADWANRYLDLLESDPNLSTDKEIQKLRDLMMEKEYGATSFENIDMLLFLLQKNKQNHMAFEYLMASYLVTAQLDKLVQNLDRLDDFDYPQIPSLYEEAILIYQSTTSKEIDLKGRQISLESRQRFERINQTFDRYMGNKQAAANEVATYYGDSYFFYYTYGVSGLKKWGSTISTF